MSQCIVPKWNLRQVDEGVAEEERNRSPHVHSDQNLCYVVPMCSNHEVTELTWQNGQLSVHGIVGPKATWDGGKLPGGTLESIVDQATCYRRVEDGGAAGVKRKSAVEESACGSASAADTTMMTWPSFESPRSMKTARTTADDDSVYHDCSENQVEGERTTKEESCRSHSSARRSRAAAVHNLSERRRRDRINQKMKTLQKLVPNASKTDKASMLDEVIEYLKQLQAQVHMMSNARNMSPMMLPMGMQQLQMSLLARMSMGMGMGMGMLDVNNMSRNHHLPQSFPSLIHPPTPLTASTPSFVPPPFTMPTVVSSPTLTMKPNVDPATAVSDFNDAYSTFLAQQSMNMDFLNKVQSALYRQQGSHQQPNKVPVNLPLPNHAQLDSHDNFYTKCKEL